MRRRTPRLVITVVTTAAVALASTGCGGDDGGGPRAAAPTMEPPATQAATSPSSPTSQDEAELRQLANDWFATTKQIYIEGADPAIAADFISGDYLSGFRQQVEDFRSSGKAGQADPEARTSSVVTGIRVENDAAIVEQCVVDGDLLLEAATGRVIDDGVTTTRYESVAARTPDGWRFTERSIVDRIENKQECPN